MIFDCWKHVRNYESMHPGFTRAIEAIENAGELAVGKHEIFGDRLFLIVGEEMGRGAVSPLESHRQFIDVQYIVTGTERFGWRSIDDSVVSTPYDVDRDISFYHDPPSFWFDAPAGHFALFIPEDAHAPLAGRGPVRKIVAKVAKDWRS